MIIIRCWHYKLISYLPKSQLLAQWRELNSIFVNQPNHILINYVYKEPKAYLYNYSCAVIDEMRSRKYNISDSAFSHFVNYFEDFHNYMDKSMFPQHDNEYLTICYYNLKEKYICGQKDFADEIWNKLHRFYYQEQTHQEVNRND